MLSSHVQCAFERATLHMACSVGAVCAGSERDLTADEHAMGSGIQLLSGAKEAQRKEIEETRKTLLTGLRKDVLERERAFAADPAPHHLVATLRTEVELTNENLKLENKAKPEHRIFFRDEAVAKARRELYVAAKKWMDAHAPPPKDTKQPTTAAKDTTEVAATAQ